MPLISIEEAIEEFRQGKFLIVVDDAKRENEGDLTIAAEAVTPEAINFMITNARGMLCVPVTRDCLERLNIPMMAKDESEAIHGTAYAMSIDYLKDNTTGISAYDRAATIRALLDPTARPEDFAQPGHTFPLRYCEGGVLARPGHTEASVDLARLSGMQPAAAICEVTNQNGTMARMPDLEDFSREHGINLISIAQLIAHRRRTERLAERVGRRGCPPSTRTSPSTGTGAGTAASSTRRWFWGVGSRRKLCWCEFIASALRETYSGVCAATAGRRWSTRCRLSPKRGRVCSSTWARKGEGLGCTIRFCHIICRTMG